MSKSSVYEATSCPGLLSNNQKLSLKNASRKTRKLDLYASFPRLSLAVYGIMMCGHTTPDVEAKWGDYGDMAEVLLKDAGKKERWIKFNVCDGVFPTKQEYLSLQVWIPNPLNHW